MTTEPTPQPTSPPGRPAAPGAVGDADLSLIRWFLTLTPTERLATAQDMVDTVWALRHGRVAEQGEDPSSP